MIKSLPSCGTRKFFTVLIRTHRWILTSARWNSHFLMSLFSYFPPIYIKLIQVVSFHQVFPTIILQAYVSHHSHSCYMPPHLMVLELILIFSVNKLWTSKQPALRCPQSRRRLYIIHMRQNCTLIQNQTSGITVTMTYLPWWWNVGACVPAYMVLCPRRQQYWWF